MRRLIPATSALLLALVCACTSPPERASRSRDAVDAPASPTGASASAPTSSTTTSGARATLELPEQLPPMPSTDLQPPSEADGGFVLDDAGEQPRAPLRFAPEPEVERTASLTLGMRVSLSGSAMPPMQQQLEPVARTLTTTLTRAGDDRLRLRSRYAPAATEQGAGLVRALELDARGRVLTSDAEPDPTATPQLARTLDTLARTLEQLLVVLPAADVAVGVGATWRFDAPVRGGGLDLDQTARVQLVAREDQRATFMVQLVQRPRSNTFTAPGQTTELELVEFTGEGVAWIVYDLAAVQPIALVAKLETKFSAATTTAPVNQVDFDLRVELLLEPS